MKRNFTRTETTTEECTPPTVLENDFHARAMALIEDQLPVAIAMGRESATHGLLKTLHLIAGGSSMGDSIGSGACNAVPRPNGGY